MCRRVRTWHGCFQPCVYDNGGDELSAETLTQPGTSGVGARWGRREGRCSEGQRDGDADGGQGQGPAEPPGKSDPGGGGGNTHSTEAGLRPPARPPRPGVQVALR